MSPGGAPCGNPLAQSTIAGVYSGDSEVADAG